MKKTIYKISIFLLLIVSVQLSSCTKATQNRMLGVWTVIPIWATGTPTYVETWEFTVDGKLIVKYGANIVSEGKYEMIQKFTKTKMVTSEMSHNFNYYQGEWFIIILKRDALYICRNNNPDTGNPPSNQDKDSGLYTVEFTR